jgi:hypothetical protein
MFVLVSMLAAAGIFTSCRSTPAPAAPAVSADTWAVVDGRTITREDVDKAYPRSHTSRPDNATCRRRACGTALPRRSERARSSCSVWRISRRYGTMPLWSITWRAVSSSRKVRRRIFRSRRLKGDEVGAFASAVVVPLPQRRRPYCQRLPGYCAFFACSANAAPCGSIAFTTQSPPGTSIGPLRILPPLALMRSVAALMSGTRK